MVGETELQELLWAAGPIQITRSIATTWLIMAALGLGGWLATRNLRDRPGIIQTVAEGVVCAIEDIIQPLIPHHHRLVLPFIATLWLFLVPANLIGLIPGLDSPTADLSVTSSLAVLVFLSAHWFGIRLDGWRQYLLHYLSPSPLLLPLHLISEATRTTALAIRLFGNIMSMETAALILLLVAGLLIPLPILMLHVVEALVQAFIFGMLATIFIASGITTQSLREEQRSSP